MLDFTVERQVELERAEAEKERKRADEAEKRLDEEKKRADKLAEEVKKLKEQLANNNQYKLQKGSCLMETAFTKNMQPLVAV